MLTRAMRIGVVLALLGAPHAANAQATAGAEPESTKSLARGEWPANAGTYAAARYSPLAQIDRNNAKNLHIAWRWKSPDMAIKEANPSVGPSFANESKGGPANFRTQSTAVGLPIRSFFRSSTGSCDLKWRSA
jgi:hypothetical protein